MNKAIVKLIFLIIIIFYSNNCLAMDYYIQAASNDDIFIIDDEKYSAKTYCMGWSRGDLVTFVDGTAGICVSATLYNKTRNEICEVWCD